MSIGETLLGLGNRVPWVRDRSERTRVNVGALVLTLPVAGLFFAGTFLTWAVGVFWFVSALPGALYAGIFGEDMRAETVQSRGPISPGRAKAVETVDSAINSQVAVIVGGNYALLTIVGLAVRFVVIG